MTALLPTLAGGTVPRLFIGESTGDLLGRRLRSVAGLDIVGSAQTGREVSAAMKESAADIFAFPPDWLELGRSIRISLDVPERGSPAFVVAGESPGLSLVVKSHLYGMDGIVDTTQDQDAVVSRLNAVVDGSWHLSRDPAVTGLGLSHGLLSREPVIRNREDREIADLLGGGLTDDEIADLLGIPVQRVRNRIEHLIFENDLVYRTQLAVLVTSLVKVPDFS